MMKAYHITNWKSLYEVTMKGKPATEETPFEELRISPLPYLRCPVMGHNLTPQWRKLAAKSYKKGAGFELMTKGLYEHLAGLSADNVREYRGWILDYKNRPLDASGIQEHFMYNDLDVVIQGLKMLTDPEFDLIEYVEFVPNAPVKIADSPGVPESPPSFENKGGRLIKAPSLNENETNTNTKLNKNESRQEGGDSILTSLCRDSDFDSTPVFTLHLRAGILLNDMIPPKNNGDRTCQKQLLEMVKTAIDAGRCEKDIYQDVFKAAKISTRPEIKSPMGKFITEMQSLGFKLRAKRTVTT